MIELNGVYKLKKIRNFEGNDPGDYKVIELVGENNLVCEKLDGENAGEKFSGIILVRDTKKEG